MYRVWAIEYERLGFGGPVTETVAVSAESEYGAIKRLCGSRHCVVKRVRLTDLEPVYAERRIEGSERVREFDWGDTPPWEYA